MTPPCSGRGQIRFANQPARAINDVDTSGLPVGDHQAEILCDGAPVSRVTVSVVEPVSDSSSTPSSVSAMLLVLCLAALLFVVTPDGSVARRFRAKVAS